MSNPIDTNGFRFYLEFVSLGIIPLYEIIEPFGFNGCKFEKMQETKRHARSVEYLAIDKLKFVYLSGIELKKTRQKNPQGEGSNYLDMGLAWIFESLKKDGFNAKINFHFSINGLFFPYYALDLSEKELTDGEFYVECKLIQSDKVSEISKKLKDKFNAFATKNYKNVDITPIQTFKVLRKGTLSKKTSQWTCPEAFDLFFLNVGGGIFQNLYRFNHCSNLKKAEINDSLSFLYPQNQNSLKNRSRNDFKYITAKTELLDIKVNIRNVIWDQEMTSSGEFFNGGVDSELYIAWGYDADNPISGETLIYKELRNNEISKSTYSGIINIDYLPAGASIFIYFICKTYKSNNFFSGSIGCINKINKFEIDIESVKKPLNIVIDCVRYIDLIKQGLKSVNSLPVVAPLLEQGGKYYDQVCFTKNMISRNLDSLTLPLEDVLETVMEFDGDYELSNSKCEIRQGVGFYEDVEIGVFNVIPAEDYSWHYNDKAMINSVSIGYDTYSNDRDVNNSAIIIHGESEWNVPNEGKPNKFERKFKQIRDSIEIQDIVDLQIERPETSTTQEDKLVMQDITRLSVGAFNQFGYLLSQKVDNGNLQILNVDGSGDKRIIDWKGQGLAIGSQFNIISGNNSGVYQVLIIESSLLTLHPILGTVPSFTGVSFITVKYDYSGVNYVCKTNEDIVFTEGIEKEFGNLSFSVRQTMENFKEYFAMVLLNNKIGIINNVSYKNNGIAKIQRLGQLFPIQENQSFLKKDLPSPYIDDKVHKLTMVANYKDMVDMLELYKTVKGYVRCLMPNGDVLRGYLKDFKYDIIKQKLEVAELEGKFEKTTINIIGYNTNKKLIINSINVLWWEFGNLKFKAYDEKNRPLCNWINFNLVLLNGIEYPTKDDLIIALESAVI
jgi:hypothetical protein